MAGGSLEDRLRWGPMTGPEVVLVGEQVAEALAAAHRLGVVHGGVNTHNLLVDEFGQVKVSDFGVAAFGRGPDATGEVDLDPAEDVHAYGAAMVRLLTGRPDAVRERPADGGPVRLDVGMTDVVLAPAVAVLERCLAARASARPTMAECATVFATAGRLLGARRLDRLEPIDADGGRPSRPLLAPTATMDVAGPTAVTPPPAPVQAEVAPPAVVPPRQPVAHVVEPVRPRLPRGVVPAFVGLGALIALLAGVLVGALLDDDGDTAAPSPTTAAPTPIGTTATTAVASTTVTTIGIPSTTAAPSSAPTSPAPAGTLPGDLGLSRPMSRPACDGSFITLYGSAVAPEQWAPGMQSSLDLVPNGQYLLTESTCPSLNPRHNGNLIYSAFVGPFATLAEACAARDDLPSGAYVRVLDTTTPHTVQQSCD